MQADPIASLLTALEAGRPPPLAWVLRWSIDGGDPLRAAWHHAISPAHMIALLDRAGHALATEARRLAQAPMLWPASDPDRVRCDAIRRLISTPPTLTSLLVPPRAMRWTA